MEKAKLNNIWNIDSWKEFKILQQPIWPNTQNYHKIIKKISNYPSLILLDEINKLKNRLHKVADGEAFLLQGGDCAETFKEFSEENIKSKLKIFFQMATIISHGSSMDIVKIGRMAGQYSKPRSSNFETRENVTLPSYRGDSINDIKFTLKSRTPDPDRLLKAYNQSIATLNLLQPLIKNEFNNLNHFWDANLFNNTIIYNRFEKTIDNINQSLKFLNILSKKINLFSEERINEFYVSHECLLLDYEAALTKKNLNNRYYNSGAHMLWLGDRTRNINSAHVEYLSGIENPIGIKCGPNVEPDDLKLIIKKINAKNEKGKILLICRFGANKIESKLPPLINMINKHHLNVIWCCDPMHGNTYKSTNNYKTRRFQSIAKELKLFFKIHNTSPTNANGVHFEFTPNDVTECVGGIRNIQEKDLHIKYETACDPRLNHEQSIELAFLITDLIKKDINNGKN